MLPISTESHLFSKIDLGYHIISSPSQAYSQDWLRLPHSAPNPLMKPFWIPHPVLPLDDQQDGASRIAIFHLISCLQRTPSAYWALPAVSLCFQGVTGIGKTSITPRTGKLWTYELPAATWQVAKIITPPQTANTALPPLLSVSWWHCFQEQAWDEMNNSGQKRNAKNNPTFSSVVEHIKDNITMMRKGNEFL